MNNEYTKLYEILDNFMLKIKVLVAEYKNYKWLIKFEERKEYELNILIELGKLSAFLIELKESYPKNAPKEIIKISDEAYSRITDTINEISRKSYTTFYKSWCI